MSTLSLNRTPTFRPSVQPLPLDPPLTACPLCESPQLAAYDLTCTGVNLSRCRDCGVKFMNPQCSDDYLRSYYSTYISEPTPSDAATRARRTLSKLSGIELVCRHAAPGRFLSIGCGDGLELELARAHGWQVEGYDVDPDTTRRVAARLGVAVHSGDFFELDLPANTFDCVFMDQVLEHPKNPQDYLRRIHRILKPQGVFFIGCPNIMSLSNVWKTQAGKLGLRQKKRGRHYDACKHLFYYSPSVLKNLVASHFEYEILVCEGAPLSGLKISGTSRNLVDRSLALLRRKLCLLDSSFRILARKPMAVAAGD